LIIFGFYSNAWEVVRPQWLLGKDLQGSTVGIVGLGNIGLAIAKRLVPFEIGKIIYSGHTKKIAGVLKF
jgi:glyoxylate/hydroxypyruvate reductase